MHGYNLAVANTTSTDTGATAFYRASFWDNVIDAADTFTVGRLIKHDDSIEVKIHEDKLDKSTLPTDLTGFKCFVSADSDLDETFATGKYDVVEDMTTRGRHYVYEFPR
jgi:hypothetical protein